MSGMAAKFIMKALKDMADDLPQRIPKELERLAAPRTVEAARILKLREPVGLMPMPPAGEQFRPLIVHALEEIALDCEADADAASLALSTERRAQVHAFVEAMRAALA